MQLMQYSRYKKPPSIFKDPKEKKFWGGRLGNLSLPLSASLHTGFLGAEAPAPAIELKDSFCRTLERIAIKIVKRDGATLLKN